MLQVRAGSLRNRLLLSSSSVERIVASCWTLPSHKHWQEPCKVTACSRFARGIQAIGCPGGAHQSHCRHRARPHGSALPMDGEQTELVRSLALLPGPGQTQQQAGELASSTTGSILCNFGTFSWFTSPVFKSLHQKGLLTY